MNALSNTDFKKISNNARPKKAWILRIMALDDVCIPLSVR